MNANRNNLNNKCNLANTKAGFTLLEMSIVFIILGLLVVTVIAGQKIIRNTRLVSVVSDIENLRIAIYNFEAKYNSLPGDMVDATSYWGSTANGNGDGLVGTGGEDLRLWQHLSLDGQLEESYSGSGTFSVGENLPISTLDPNAGYRFIDGTIGAGYGKNGNRVEFAASNAAGTAFTNPILKAEDAAAIDKKADDGLAATGNVVAEQGTGATAGDCITSSAYKLSGTEKSCVMAFWLE